MIQPDVKVEWEEQLPLFEYALRLPFYAIHKLGDILRDLVKKGRPAKMLQAMQCAWRFHYWQHPEGRAFDLVMVRVSVSIVCVRWLVMVCHRHVLHLCPVCVE